MPPLPRILNERVLAEISPAEPAGRDVSSAKEWVEIAGARKAALDEAPENARLAWQRCLDLAVEVLATKTKDLRVARCILEGLIHVHGFEGLQDGLWLFQELLDRYWDRSLYPLPEAGDSGARAAVLQSLDQKLPAEIKAIPLTKRDGEPGYSRSHFETARDSKWAEVTLAQFNEAMAATPAEDLRSLQAGIADAAQGLASLDNRCSQRLGLPQSTELQLFQSSAEALADCSKLIEGALRQRRAEPASGRDGPEGAGTAPPGGSLDSLFGSAALGPWQKAEEMVRSGQVEQGLREMAHIAAAESNGRDRFFRKLLLADVCIRTRRDKLAVKILEELNEQIETFKLAQWETTQVVGAVWTRLHRLYVKTEAKEGAEKLYHVLSRLDPWQAIDL